MERAYRAQSVFQLRESRVVTPEVIYNSTSGKPLENYPDAVFEGKRVFRIVPDEAKSRAEKTGWDRLSG